MDAGDTVSAEPRRRGITFFISYAEVDLKWAEWVAWQIEEAGYRALLQAWDAVPGTHAVVTVDTGVRQCDYTISVLSRAYQASEQDAAQWQAAWRDDPSGAARKLIPVQVEQGTARGLLAGIVPIDLVGLADGEARDRLLGGLEHTLRGRAKPSAEPEFPAPPATRSGPPSAGFSWPTRPARRTTSPPFPGPGSWGLLGLGGLAGLGSRQARGSDSSNFAGDPEEARESMPPAHPLPAQPTPIRPGSQWGTSPHNSIAATDDPDAVPPVAGPNTRYGGHDPYDDEQPGYRGNIPNDDSRLGPGWQYGEPAEYIAVDTSMNNDGAGDAYGPGHDSADLGGGLDTA